MTYEQFMQVRACVWHRQQHCDQEAARCTLLDLDEVSSLWKKWQREADEALRGLESLEWKHGPDGELRIDEKETYSDPPENVVAQFDNDQHLDAAMDRMIEEVQ